jgi:hypothetical protein
MSVTNLELATYYLRKGAESAFSRALRPVLNRTAPWTNETRPEPRFDVIDPALAHESIVAEVRSFTIDIEDFRQWAAAGQYPALAYLVNKDEKILEHYVSFVLLDLKATGTVIDVASCRSFFPDIMRRRGYRVIAQDLSYPGGLHGDRLGGDAAAMNLPEGSVAGMTLHCSFEHFEGDADSRFVRNVGPLLQPGGRVVILPLYLSHKYCVETDPLVSAGRIPVDPGAELVASFGYGNRHGRHYNVEALSRRVLQTARDSGLKSTIYIMQNTKDVSAQCYLRYALVLEKPA